MHGIVGIFGGFIFIGFAAALALAFVSGFKPIKSAITVGGLLLAISLLQMLIDSYSAESIVVHLMVTSLAIVIGAFGSLPGAVIGRRLRTSILKRN